jgi:hypothetical protein
MGKLNDWANKNDGCVPWCKHWSPIPEEMVQEAIKWQKWSRKNKDQHGTFMVKDTNFWGTLAQMGTPIFLEQEGIKIDKVRPMYEKDEGKEHTGDNGDWQHRGADIDVKGSRMDFFKGTTDKANKVYWNSRLLIRSDKQHLYYPYYVFVKIDLGGKNYVDMKKDIYDYDLNESSLHLAGMVSYEDFWETYAKPFGSPNAKHPSHGIKARYTQSFADWVMGGSYVRKKYKIYENRNNSRSRY